MPRSKRAAPAPGFPFRRLPQLVQWEIIRKAEIADVIAMSYCSQRMRKTVRAAGTECDLLCKIEASKPGWVLEVNQKFTITVRENGRYSEVRLKFKDSTRSMLLLKTHVGFNSLYQLTLHHLLNTFRRIGNFSVTFELKTKEDIGSHPIWTMRKQLTQLLVESREKRLLTEEELKFIFEELTIEKKLEICPLVVDGFKKTEGFTQEIMIINNPSWIDFEALINSQSREIALYFSPKPLLEQLVEFSKAWVSGEKLQNLETFKLVLDDDSEFLVEDFGQVMDAVGGEEHDVDKTKIERVDGKHAIVEVKDWKFEFKVCCD